MNKEKKESIIIFSMFIIIIVLMIPMMYDWLIEIEKNGGKPISYLSISDYIRLFISFLCCIVIIIKTNYLQRYN